MFRKALSILSLLVRSVGAAFAQQANTAILVGIVATPATGKLPGATVSAEAPSHEHSRRRRHRRARTVPDAAACGWRVRRSSFSSTASARSCRRGVVLNIGDVRKSTSGWTSERSPRRSPSRRRRLRSTRRTRRSARSSPTSRSRRCRSTAATICSWRRCPRHRAGQQPGRCHWRAVRNRRRLPARRPRQQQPADLDRAFGAEGNRQAVGRRDPGIQGRHQQLLGRIRPLVVGRRQRVAQVGHERPQGQSLRVLPGRCAQRDELLRDDEGR